ncbi:DNA cytosine methyltransferase [Flavobacterium sp. LB2P53]|uniref:DNA cytosine methyltransferase n=1 Tax=Flavobacterium sp. LB2P53 TaxID=2497481 RepID=UPI001315209B|nr:DNA cytosine methyltransferase [Flavobacterium sp. LB2P53]
MKPTKNKSINVLSLFDGISCAKLALDKAGIRISNYYSSEIDKSALAIQNYHYSGDTSFHQIGDVKDVDIIDYPNVDLVIFGSPCTQLSSVNSKDRSGLDGPDSSLFYEAIRILHDLKKYQHRTKKLHFIMENVASMDTKNRKLITSELENIFGDEVYMIKINSSLIAPSHRRRLYWTNIPDITIPEPIEFKFSDIIHNGYVEKEKANVLLSGNVTLTNGIFRHYKMNLGNVIYKDKEFADLSIEQKLLEYPFILNKSGYVGKSRSAFGEYDFPNKCYRLPSVLESERLMTIRDGYVSDVPNVSKTNKLKAIGLAMTVDVVAVLLEKLKGDNNIAKVENACRS